MVLSAGCFATCTIQTLVRKLLTMTMHQQELFTLRKTKKIFLFFLNIVTYFLSNSCSSAFCKLRHFILQFFDFFFLLFLLKECLEEKQQSEIWLIFQCDTRSTNRKTHTAQKTPFFPFYFGVADTETQQESKNSENMLH